MASTQLSREAKCVFILLILSALFLIWDQLYWWETIAEYSFGYIVPILAGYILWERWPKIKAILFGLNTSTSGENTFWKKVEHKYPALVSIFEILALLVIVAGLFFFWGGSLVRAAQGHRVGASLAIASSFGCIALAGIFLISKYAAKKTIIPIGQRIQLTSLFLFPSFVWILSIPIIDELQRKLSLFLLDKVTSVVFFTFEIIGLALIREGNILLLPEGRVGIAEACSGIRSLTACLFVGAFLGAAFLNALWKKIVLVLLAMLFAFLTNIIRSLFLTSWAYINGSEALEDKYFNLSVHDLTGYAVLFLTSIIMILLLPLFNQEESIVKATKSK